MAGAAKVGAHKTSMLQDSKRASDGNRRDRRRGRRAGGPARRAGAGDTNRVRLREDAGRTRRATEKRVKIHNRWFQLVASLIAMIMIANLQYAWTLFVKPMQQATGWKLSDIQLAFTLFILFQTWVQPAQGLLIDRPGPAAVHQRRGRAVRHRLGRLGSPRRCRCSTRCMCIAGIGAALVYGGCMGSALKWFTKRARAGGGHHRGGLRRRHGALHPVHRVDDREQRLSDGVHLHRHLSGRRDPDRRAVPAPSAAEPRAPRRRRASRSASSASISSRPAKCCARRSSTCSTRCS